MKTKVQDLTLILIIKGKLWKEVQLLMKHIMKKLVKTILDLFIKKVNGKKRYLNNNKKKQKV